MLGPASVNEGANFRLNLSASNLPAAVQNWTINWGDGNTQTVAGNPSFVDHVYDDGGQNSNTDPNATILAQVTTVTNQTFAAQGGTRFEGDGLDPTFGTDGIRVTTASGQARVEFGKASRECAHLMLRPGRTTPDTGMFEYRIESGGNCDRIHIQLRRMIPA